MEIEQRILMNNRCYKIGNKIKVKGLMLHSVGVSQPKAQVFINAWNKSDQLNCVHAVIDGETGTIYQTLPWDYRGWHCGQGDKGTANATHIGVEMCESPAIKYTVGNNFSCCDKNAVLEVVKRTYKSAVELFAFLCKEFKLDPLKDGVIISHKEGGDRGVASAHSDPEHLWIEVDSGYTMDGFRRDVSEAMKMGK